MLAVAIFGPIGVVLAAMLVKSMEMEMLKWLVAFIVIYTSWTMASWRGRATASPPAGGRLGVAPALVAQLAADIAG